MTTPRPNATHAQLLLDALRAHGRTSYHELLTRYADAGYTYSGFVVAVCRARKQGLIDGTPRTQGGAIVRAGCCPCCGREL